MGDQAEPTATTDVQANKARKLIKNSVRILVFISVFLLLIDIIYIPQTLGPTSSALRWFPVLVLTPDGMKETYQAHVMFKPELEEFLKGHAQYTFLVPERQEAQLQAQWEGQPYHVRGPHSFRVLERFNDKQILEVTLRWGSGDHEHVGVYEAKDKEIVPMRYADRSSFILVTKFLFIGFIALVVGALLWRLISELIWWVVARF